MKMVFQSYANLIFTVDIYNLFANVKFQNERGRAIIIIKRTREPWQSPYKGTGVEKAWECCQHTFLALYIAADESNKNASSHLKHVRVLVAYKWEGNFNQWILILLPLSSFRESISVCLDNPSRWSACENVGFLQVCVCFWFWARNTAVLKTMRRLFFFRWHEKKILRQQPSMVYFIQVLRASSELFFDDSVHIRFASCSLCWD